LGGFVVVEVTEVAVATTTPLSFFTVAVVVVVVVVLEDDVVAASLDVAFKFDVDVPPALESLLLSSLLAVVLIVQQHTGSSAGTAVTVLM